MATPRAPSPALIPVAGALVFLGDWAVDGITRSKGWTWARMLALLALPVNGQTLDHRPLPPPAPLFRDSGNIVNTAIGTIDVGIANFVTFLENTREYRRALREAEYGPLTDPEFLKSISPIHKVDKIVAPLLIIHGANDPRVPVDEARQIAKALGDRGVAVDTLIFYDEGHGTSKRSNVLLEYRRRVDFFNKYLK